MGTVSTANVTRSELVRMAFRRIGVANPSQDEMANAVVNLNALIKRVDVEGRWLWAINATATTLATVNAQKSYAVGTGGIAANILELEQVFYMQSANNSIPLEIIESSDFMSSVYRDDTGQPVQVYLETAPVLANQKLWVRPTPDAAYNLEYYYRRRIYDFTLATDNPDMPGEWIDALKKRLSADLAPEYGIPLDVRNDLRLEAQEAMRLVNADNAEAAPESTLQTIYF
jgi:hypothetical protein